MCGKVLQLGMLTQWSLSSYEAVAGRRIGEPGTVIAHPGHRHDLRYGGVTMPGFDQSGHNLTHLPSGLRCGINSRR